MTPEFPSIWLQSKNANGKTTLIAGFYREWSQNGKDSEDDQIFVKQIEAGSNITNRVLILGDANLCTLK